jgi:hypothetical protein
VSKQGRQGSVFIKGRVEICCIQLSKSCNSPVFVALPGKDGFFKVFRFSACGEKNLFQLLQHLFQPAVLFHDNTPLLRFGFAQVGRRRNYYQEPVEDALVLRRPLRTGTPLNLQD